MLVEGCQDLVWSVARCDAGNDNIWLSKAEAVVWEWSTGAWEWCAIRMEKFK